MYTLVSGIVFEKGQEKQKMLKLDALSANKRPVNNDSTNGLIHFK